jgi:hypothetical protein
MNNAQHEALKPPHSIFSLQRQIRPFINLFVYVILIEFDGILKDMEVLKVKNRGGGGGRKKFMVYQ